MATITSYILEPNSPLLHLNDQRQATHLLSKIEKGESADISLSAIKMGSVNG